MEIILLAILSSYILTIEDYGGELVEWKLWVVDEIDRIYCNSASGQTIGCTNHFFKVIQVIGEYGHHQSILGIDVYAHEIIHARCDKYHPTLN